MSREVFQRRQYETNLYYFLLRFNIKLTFITCYNFLNRSFKLEQGFRHDVTDVILDVKILLVTDP